MNLQTAVLKKEAQEGLLLEGESVVAVYEFRQSIVYGVLCVSRAVSEERVAFAVDLLAVGLEHLFVSSHFVVLLCDLFCLGSCYNGQTTTMRFCK